MQKQLGDRGMGMEGLGGVAWFCKSSKGQFRVGFFKGEIKYYHTPTQCELASPVKEPIVTLC